MRRDSTAALAISRRVGLGKVRHIQVQYLWIQERHYEGSLNLSKVKGELNPSDMLTKGVPQEILSRHMRTADMEPRGGSLTTTGREVGKASIGMSAQIKNSPEGLEELSISRAVSEIASEGRIEKLIIRNFVT